jgi:hypothetical protein
LTKRSIAPSLSRQFLAALKPVLEDVASPPQIAEIEMRAVLIADIEKELAIASPLELFAQKAMASWWAAPLLGSPASAGNLGSKNWMYFCRPPV